MKKAYLAISYSNRKNLNDEVECLTEVLNALNIELFVFVDRYNFKSNQENEMMQTAFSEIAESDILIAELTVKSIGVGIELGYAKATGKPIIYIRKHGSEYSTTAAGSAAHCLEYEGLSDLAGKVRLIIGEI